MAANPPAAPVPADPAPAAPPAVTSTAPAPRTGRPAGAARSRARAASAAGERATGMLARRVRSPLHHEWVASVLGVTLGVAFTACFLTGLVDHFAQEPGSWLHLPTHPLELYRVNEGIHVVTGVASIPLLVAKLWTVYPKLFAWPPVRSIAHGLERLSLVFLVGGSLFELVTGVINIDYWYSPMPFFFTTGHYWVAWMLVGALVIHVGAKGLTAAHAIARGPGAVTATADGERVGDTDGVTPDDAEATRGLSRRGFVGVAFAVAGTLTLTVVGETVAPLRKLALLAPRNPVVGPQHVPVNQTALQAGVTATALDHAWRLRVGGRCARPREFSLAELRRLPQRDAGLPITCVEGWSASAQWRGVPLVSVLDMVGAPAGAAVRVESLESDHRLYSSSVVDAAHARDPDTLLALELNGEVLDIDHGYPVRLIAPDRPGVLQTKWLSRIVVL